MLSARIRKNILRMAALAACAFCVFAISLKLYISSDDAAVRLSGLFSGYLRHSVRIASISTSGLGVTLHNVSLSNPSAFPEGRLVDAQTITVAVDPWLALRGRRGLKRLELEGVKVALVKGADGEWNYAELRRLLTPKKPSPTEFYLRHLTLKDCTLLVNGRESRLSSLRLDNLASKGSSQAGFELSFSDPLKNSYLLSGVFRPGIDPDFEMKLSAPTLVLNRPAAGRDAGQGSSGSLLMTAVMRSGLLKLDGQLDFSHALLLKGAGRLPLSGRISLAASYDLKDDLARLESMTLTVPDLLRMNADAVVRGVKGRRSFSVNLGLSDIDLARLQARLQQERQGRALIAGLLRCRGFSFSGDGASGVTSASGTLLLENLSLVMDGRAYLKGGGARFNLSRSAGGFVLDGLINADSHSKEVLLDRLQAALAVKFSNRLILVAANLKSFKAFFCGLDLDGQATWSPSRPQPVVSSVRISVRNPAESAPLLSKYGVDLTSAAGGLVANLAGRSANDFNALLRGRFDALRFAKGGKQYRINGLQFNSEVTAVAGRRVASGDLSLQGGLFNGKAVQGRSAYMFADGLLRLRKLDFNIAGNNGGAEGLSLRLDSLRGANGRTGLPLDVVFEKAFYRRAKLAVERVNGGYKGRLYYTPGGRWLDGNLKAVAGSFVWLGKDLGQPAVDLRFSKAGATGDAGGQLFGGRLTGTLAFNPFAPSFGIDFRLDLKNGRAAEVGRIIPGRYGSLFNDGLVNSIWRCSYTTARGFVGRYGLEARDLRLVNGRGRTILENGRLNVAGEISRQLFSVSAAELRVGDAISATVDGKMLDPFVPARSGSFRYRLKPVPLNSLVDSFVNVLPAVVQEATVSGELESGGQLQLYAGRVLLDAALHLKGGGIDVPSQKLTVQSLNGVIPVSLDLSGKTPLTDDDEMDFTRQQYLLIHPRMRAVVMREPLLHIGGASFGALKLGPSSVQFKAEDGLTRIVLLRSSLYDGAMMGTGAMVYNRGVKYRLDLFLNSLSLNQFCANIPKIRNYISGRVDGVISVSGDASRKNSLIGFSELWTREEGDEGMKVSRDFLQKLSGKKVSGFFFQSDRPFDTAEITAVFEDGYLTFDQLEISNTNMIGVRDLNVTIAPSQNRISLSHLLDTIRQAVERGKPTATGVDTLETPAEPDFKWDQ